MNGIIFAAMAAAVSVNVQPQADGTRTLVQETVLDAPVADVWKAISTADGWTSWAAPVAWQSAPDVIETSYDKTATPGDKSTIRQKILAKVPQRLILFQTVKAPDGFPHFETYRKVVNLLEIEPLGSTRTRIRLTGSGYENSDAGQQLLGFFKKGNVEVFEHMQASFKPAPAPKPSGQLAPLGFLLGHCWRGTFAGTGQQDTHCFEPIYGGAFVRDRHEVTGRGDPYRGESLYAWNAAAKAVEYTYWNSSGGISRGTMTSAGDRLNFDSDQHRRADGSEVTYSTFWRRTAPDVYEVVTTQRNSPSGEQTVLYKKID